jgi:hypothetical protein
MDWVGVVSILVEPRLDALSLFAFRASVSGRFGAVSVAERASHACAAASQGHEGLLRLLIGGERYRRDLRDGDHVAYVDLPRLAIRGGHLGCLLALLDNGWSVHPATVGLLAVSGADRSTQPGRVAILEWLVESGHNIGEDPLCQPAAYTGNLECLKFARDSGCDMMSGLTESAAYCASGGGHVDCLAYAHRRGCRLTAGVAEAAARGRHLDCFAYALENGCPVDARTLNLARRNGWPCASR